MNPTRFQQARLAAGLSLQQVMDRLPPGLRVSRAALHKYETGASQPSARMLMQLAALYGVHAREFLTQPTLKVEWLAFRRRRSLGSKAAAAIQARAEGQAERQLRVEALFPSGPRRSFATRTRVRSFEDAERAAGSVRKHWRMGEAPVESLTEAIEANGGVVVEIAEAPKGFDGLSGWSSQHHPVLVVRGDAPPDRRRHTLAHELGHLVMSAEPGADEEALAHRFAAALQVPAAVAYLELGKSRRKLSLDELLVLKQRYGMSVQAWVRRAFDLEIISKASYVASYREVARRGWRVEEPCVYDAERPSSRLRQLLSRALAEGMLSADEAEQLLPGVTSEYLPPQPHRARARELLRKPMTERSAAMSLAAEKAAPEYRRGGSLERFEAFSEKDLYDDDATKT